MNIIGQSTTGNPHNFLDQELIGATIADRYEVIELLARGGMGRIYRGRQTQLGRDVVLKVLPAIQGMDDDASQKRFLREAAISSRLQHPNTVTVYDYGDIDLRGIQVFYIVMEFIDGVSLAEVLKQKPHLELEQALWVIWEIARALREAHNAGVIHRDLKPSNIMLMNTEEGEALKVLDFGIVKLLTEGAEGLTMNNRIVGSPRYMAPEQVLTNSADPRTDIYSLGVLLYQLVSGKLPFGTGSTTQIMMAHIRDPVPGIKEHSGVSVPEDVEAFISRCMAKEADSRFQNIDELCEGMRGLTWGGAQGTSDTATFNLQPVILQAARQAQQERQLAQAFSEKNEPTPRNITPATQPALSPPEPTSTDQKSWLLALSIGVVAAVLLLLGQWMLNRSATQDTITTPERVAEVVVVEQAEAQPEAALVIITPPEATTVREPAAELVELTLTSSPSNALVIESGEELGRTPVELMFDPADEASREFTLKRSGYRSTTVTWDPTTPDKLPSGKLKRIPTSRPSRPASPPPEPDLDIITER